MIKGILFDYDSTLSSRYESACKMYRRMMRLVLPQMDPSSIAFEAMIQRIMYWDEYGTVNKLYVLNKIKEYYAPDMDTGRWRDYWYEHFHECQVPMPGSREVLEELKKSYRLGLVTNGEGISQMAKVKALKLEPFFDTMIASGDFGRDKPDPAIFRQAAADLGLACDETAFVGDTFYTDIAGAAAAGMLPVWFCYEKRTTAEYPVIKITEFTELRKLFPGEGKWKE